MTCYAPAFAREARAAMYIKGRRCSSGFELCTSACKREATPPEPAWWVRHSWNVRCWWRIS